MKIRRIIKTKIRNKLLFGFVIISLFVGFVSYIGVRTIHDVGYSYDNISTKSLPLLQNLEEMKYACLRLVSSASEYAYIQTERKNVSKDAPLNQENELIKQSCNSCHTALSQYERIVEESFPDAVEQIKEIRKGGNLLHTAANEFIEMKKQGISGTEALEKKEQMEVGEIEFLHAVNHAIGHTNDRLEEENSQLVSTISSSLRNILVFSGLTFIISILLGLIMSRSISSPILKLTQMTNKFREGNLESTIDIKSSDEIGTLARSFKTMATNLKYSTTQLQIEKMRFQQLYENSPAGIVLLDDQNKITNSNRAFETIFQYRSDETKGFTPDELIVPNEFIEEATGLTHQTRSATIVMKETIRKRKDGTYVHVQITGVPIMIDERLSGYYAMYEDITQRKESQEAFEQLSRKNELILGSAAEGILGLDRDGNHTFVNEAAAKILGFTADELIGKPSHTMWHHTSADGTPYPEHKCSIYEVLHNGIFSRVDNEVFWRKDGTSFPAEYSSMPINDGNNIIGAVVTFNDITERKEAEKLQDAVYRITKVADVSPTIDDLFKNVHNIIKEVMPADNFYIALYDEKENLISTPYYVDEADPLEPPRKPRKGLTEYVIFNSTSILCDKKMFNEMQTRGEVELVGSPSPIWLGVPLIVNNKTIGMMAAQHYTDESVYGKREQRIFEFVSSEIARVIEKRIAVEQEVKLMRELESTNKELNDFAYIVSHDLKAPLRAIGSLANWLTNDYSDKFDDQGKELMTLLDNRVSRMVGLIDGILQYSRIGRMKEEKTSIELNSFVIDAIQFLAPPEHITIKIDNHLPTIVCEKTRLQQVFQNLISNAIKYIDKPKGEIHIGCESENGYWKFSIKDNGPGIEEKHFEKIFQIFQTLTSRDQFESTGIGLTIVKKIVEMNGGRIWVESEVGKGTTFLFTLPEKGEQI